MADADTTVTIAIRANVEAFKKAMQDAKKSVRDTGKAVKADTEKMSADIQSAAAGKKEGFGKMIESIKGVSPALDGAIGTVSDMRDRFKGAGKAGKAAMLAVGGAVAGLAIGIAVKLGKAIMETTGKLAKMADPVRFDKAASEMKESLRTLKTSLGQLASPVFEIMAKAVSAVAKGLNWVVEKVMLLVGALQGLLGLGHKVNQTISGAADAMDEAGAAADAGLASFDKLNTLNIGEMGDMDQAQKLADSMDSIRKKGEEVRKKIGESLKPVSEIVDKIKGLINLDLGSAWVRFKDSAVSAWDGIKATSANAWDYIREAAGNAWETIRVTASGVWSGLTATAGNAWDTIKDLALRQWDAVKSAALGIWDGIKTYILQSFDPLAKALSDVFNGVINVFQTAWDRVFGAIRGAIQWVLDKIEWLTGKIRGLRDTVSGAVSGISGWIGQKWNNFKGAIGFAKGGVFQPNSPQLVMVGDNKTEPEVIAPRSMIMDAMRQVIGETGMAGGRTENITLTIDGKTLARYTYDDMQAEGRRRGTGAMI